MKAVDELIAEEFLKGSWSHWSLNCLVYASADLVSRLVRRTFVEKPRNQSHLKRKKAQMLQLCRKIGWLEAEICKRKSGKWATPRQCNNSRRLRKECCFLHELKVYRDDEGLAESEQPSFTKSMLCHMLLPLMPLTIGRVPPVCDQMGLKMVRRAPSTRQQMRFSVLGRHYRSGGVLGPWWSGICRLGLKQSVRSSLSERYQSHQWMSLGMLEEKLIAGRPSDEMASAVFGGSNLTWLQSFSG